MSRAGHRAPGSEAPGFAHRDPGGTVPSEAVAFVVGPTLLAKGAPTGPLSGTRFAVKDLIEVEGTRTGCGNPDRLADAPIAVSHAPVVAALLGAGSDCVGKTVTDELAYSLSGTNVHYGTPTNPAAPGRVPGGSSSGSASAVAAGQVDLALGTDTGGSIRVPASYCGIFGIRTTHGRVDVAGVTPLAPSFDTVGLLAASAELLGLGLRALLAGAPGPAGAASATTSAPARLIVDTSLLELVDEGGSGAAGRALRKAAELLAERGGLELFDASLATTAELEEFAEAFRVLQMLEAWASDGEWITVRRPRLGPGIAARFEAASKVDAARRVDALRRREDLRSRLAALLGDDGVLAQPAATGAAPRIGPDVASRSNLRARTLTLTAPAGLAAAPVVALPLCVVDGAPLGLALVGRPGDDELLCDLACATTRPLA